METAPEVTGGKPPQPPALSPRPAPPRPEPGGPQPRGLPPRPPLSREPDEHTSIDGVAHSGKVSVQLAGAWQLPSLGPLVLGTGVRRQGSAWTPPSAGSQEGEAGVRPRASGGGRQ